MTSRSDHYNMLMQRDLSRQPPDFLTTDIMSWEVSRIPYLVVSRGLHAFLCSLYIYSYILYIMSVLSVRPIRRAFRPDVSPDVYPDASLCHVFCTVPMLAAFSLQPFTPTLVP